MTYQPNEIEKKWQDFWDKHDSFKTREDASKPKYYVLDMFPYPSGDGLHVGHVEGYTATDIVARYKRMRGFNVLHPMGWDAFGLPAEQYAIQNKVHPKQATERNVGNFKRQIKSLGMSYDWSREINTTDPEYYKWTQWIFTKLYEKDLAFVAEIPVNWCPALNTVLANEEVINGKSERGNHPVIRRPMRQWVLKITKYAERLLTDLEGLDWPESIKDMQRNWIGKSEGARVRFDLVGANEKLEIFTTRPETIYGCTYMVLAPEHSLVEKLTTTAQAAAVKKYQEVASGKSDLDRTELNKEKSGVFTGGFAVNPFTNEKVPVWIADYVLAHYGTGAIMAVPAHDERDREFAGKYSLPIKNVITEGGFLENSDLINGLTVKDAVKKISDVIEAKNLGQRQIQYRLRDWLFSRQRYWGEPFPILHLDDGSMRLLEANELPVMLPEVVHYEPSPTGESPLATIKDWVETKDPKSGKAAKRETNTMPQWAGSCWYYLRYIDPKNTAEAWGKDKEKYWMPVDLYIGGAEHAVLHLLYARFWHKVLFDLGLVSTKEPFQKLYNQGMILGSDNEKMSKSRGNVVNPDDVIRRYGADSLRLFEMFLGPLDKVKPWNPSAIEGVYRFLQKYWRWLHTGSETSEAISVSDTAPAEELLRLMHFSIDKVTRDMEVLSFNTAISQLMICVNEFNSAKANNRILLETVTKMLQPLAPHIAEEAWEKLGHTTNLTYEPWPKADPKYLVTTTIKLVVQVNGKLRDQFEAPKEITEAEAFAMAEAREAVANQLAGKTVKKRVYVPGRLINFVVG